MTDPVPRSLHEHDFRHLEQLIAALDRLVNARVDAVEKQADSMRRVDQEAVKVLAANFEKRMDNTNEWRSVVESSQANFANKEETDRRLKMLEDYKTADQTKDKTTGMNAALLMQLLIAASVIISIVVFFANR